jgi:hypothetical protein
MSGRAALPPLKAAGALGVFSAAGDGPAVNVGGSWAATVSFPGLTGSLTSLALGEAPPDRDGESIGRLRCLTGATMSVTNDDVTITGDSASGGVVDPGLR